MDTLHKDRPFSLFQLTVHTCGYGRKYGSRQSLYIGLDISIYSMYVIESEVAEFCPITHSPPSPSQLLLSSKYQIKGKMVSVIVIISLGSLT